MAFRSLLLLLFHSRCRPLILVIERPSVDLFEILVLGRGRLLSLRHRSHQLWGATQHASKLTPGSCPNVNRLGIEAVRCLFVHFRPLPRTGFLHGGAMKCRANFTLLLLPLVFTSIIIIIISIQPEGRLWQEPEPSQATGMALAHCILGSFLGVGCHCFPPPLDVPTFASRCLHASDMRDLYQRKTELWARNGRSILPVIPTST